jgi:hypothetical protein
MPSALVASAAVGQEWMGQPTTRREWASSTTGQSTLPSWGCSKWTLHVHAGTAPARPAATPPASSAGAASEGRNRVHATGRASRSTCG